MARYGLCLVSHASKEPRELRRHHPTERGHLQSPQAPANTRVCATGVAVKCTRTGWSQCGKSGVEGPGGFVRWGFRLSVVTHPPSEDRPNFRHISEVVQNWIIPSADEFRRQSNGRCPQSYGASVPARTSPRFKRDIYPQRQQARSGTPEKRKPTRWNGLSTVFAELQGSTEPGNSLRWLPPSLAGNGMHRASVCQT